VRRDEGLLVGCEEDRRPPCRAELASLTPGSSSRDISGENGQISNNLRTILMRIKMSVSKL